MAEKNYETPDSETKANAQYNPYGSARDLYRQETTESDGVGRSQSETTNDAQASSSAEQTRRAEEKPWETNISSKSGGGKNTSRGGKLLNFLKKRGAPLGAGTGLIGIILALTGVTGPALLPINLMSNFTITNDSSSPTFERRFFRFFDYANKEQNNVECSKKSIKCSMGKISNSALSDLSDKGVIPVVDGVEYKPKKSGYPDKNPTAYKVTTNDGKTKTIKATDMSEFLADKNNREVAAKVFGTGGAFNFRVKAWAGKHITSKFYSKFGIKRNGGVATGSNKTLEEKLAEAISSALSGPKNVESASSRVIAKIEHIINKAKKGGVGYTVAVAACTGVKAPRVIATGAVAVQLAQVAPIVMNVILSPASKAKGSGVDIANSISATDIEMIGTLLTQQTKNSEGKMTSALDSQYLLAAMGVNKGKPAVSKKFTPGYGLLTNPVIVAANEADRKLEPSCNAIMSPTAMYTAMAVDAAVTVAASATIIGGVIKIAASWVISELASEATKAIVGDQAKELLLDLAKNDSIPKAKGEEFGDVLGISAAAFFSAGGMSRHLPTLTVSQLGESNKIKADNENFHREMEIASRSPFDVSSQYTFLGSIVHNFTTAMIANGSYSTNFLPSLTTTLANIPSIALSIPTAGAASFTEESCNYAKAFNLETENKADTPAINMAGMPCTGNTAMQDSMGTGTAINLMINEGWICNPETENCPELEDNASIEDLMPNTSGDCDSDLPETCHQGNGYIKKDSLLYEYIESCSNPQSGDYIYNSASCTVPSDVENAAKAVYNCNNGQIDSREEGGQPTTGNTCSQANQGDFNEDLPDLKDPRSVPAMAVFLEDFQGNKSMNGEDKGEVVQNTPETSNLVTGTPDDVKKLGRGWTLEENTDYTGVKCAPGTTSEGSYLHKGFKSEFNLCKVTGTGLIVNSLVSGNVRAMVDAAKADGVKLNGGSFRTYEQQIETRRRNCTGDPMTTTNCNPPTATPGKSQHERALAIDFTNCSERSTACYKWLNKNAKKYGYYNLASEPWHWSTSGN